MSDTKEKSTKPVAEKSEKKAAKKSAEFAQDVKAIKKLNETLLKKEIELEEKIEQLEGEIEKLEGEKNNNHDMYLRSVAEFDNFKKRTAKEKAAIYNDSVADVVERLLPLIDNFERALASFDASDNADVASYKDGMALLFKQFTDMLTSLGVEEIEAEGAEFDPNIHNAVMHVEDDSYGENCVAEVLLKGYKINEKVIRPSMVKVAN